MPLPSPQLLPHLWSVPPRVASLVVLSIFLAGLVGGTIINVVDHGAVGDGNTDDTNAFLKAWEVACGDASTPKFLIPGGKTFLLSKTFLSGPCKSRLDVQISGNLVAPNNVWTREMTNWISFYNINNLTIYGSGQLDGRGQLWWDCKAKRQCNVVPYGLGILFCNNFRMSGLRFINPSGKHMTVYQSVGVEIRDLTITAPGDSPNTDGMFIEECQHVRIENCIIQTGDDCIAIGTGSLDVNITNIQCGPGHGISIGSLGGDQSTSIVEQIRVSYCSFYGSTNGARIKTWQGGHGFARGISFENLTFYGVQMPIVIDQFYCGGASNCPNHTTAVQVSDVQFVNTRGTTTGDVAIKIACSETVPCTGILLENVHIWPLQKQATSYCLSAHGTSLGDVNPHVPCLYEQHSQCSFLT